MKEITVNADLQNLDDVTDFIDDELEQSGVELAMQTRINVVIDEIFSNIVNYAYKDGQGDVTVSVEVSEDPRAIVLIFTDSGIPYDPLSAEEPDITLSAEDRKIGGLGIFIVKKIMDEISHVYENGRNILQMRKNL